MATAAGTSAVATALTALGGGRSLAQILAEPLHRRPQLWSFIVGGVLGAVGDTTAQLMAKEDKYHLNQGHLEERLSHPSSSTRTSSMALWGASLGFGFPFWYAYLDRTFRNVTTRLLVHQGFMSPICNCAFLAYVELVRDPATAFSRIPQRIEADGLYLTCRALPFWLTVNAVTFRLVPLMYRSVTMSSAGCVW
eukprot:CAMPEP_0170622108 /NCGR_PEP_ID=MMETSP0224-20130122/28951_1 /TAXON_ID=285029 /ORGANISM="Togula jolla, Strain CCCM 725" /LENGTH=193 /DNA_ID=CAMNT_0010948397 /DNA_START=74 /DNA_END=652 /DNA_ORIENTATION=-